MSRSRRAASTLSRIVALVALTAPAGAIDFHVDSNLDQIDDDVFDGLCHTAGNTCTLRAAVMQASVISGAGAKIFVPSGTYLLTRPAVGDNGPESGDLNLETPTSGNPVIEIVGSGAAITIVDANDLDRVFRVEAGRTAILRNLTMRNGFALDGAGIHVSGPGTTLERCEIRDNAASGNGGGIYTAATVLKVFESTIRNNSALHGGGVYSFGKLRMDASTVSDNFASGQGSPGGTSDGGGGLVNRDEAFINNSTLSGNRTNGEGGGVLAFGYAYLTSSTVAFNRADDDDNGGDGGGGVFVHPFDAVNQVELRNSMVAGNVVATPPVASDCNAVEAIDKSLLGSLTNCSVDFGGNVDLLNSLALIGPLADNGGPTRTHALLEGSNAIDGGNPNGCYGVGENGYFFSLDYDQRGFGRQAGATCDVGSYEFDSDDAVLIDGFESGGIAAWSDIQGLACPVVPASFELEEGKLDGEPGSRVVLFHGSHLVSELEIVQFARVELYEDFGGPMEPDSVDLELDGNDNYDTCGTCVLLNTEVGTENGPGQRTFFQQSGTLTISALTPSDGGAFNGTVSAILEEVTIDDLFHSTPVPGGCVIPVSFSFSTTLDAAP